MRLSVDAINEQSPYWVIQLDDMLFRFATRNGIRCHVGFYPDTFFLNEGAYHLFIERIHDDHTPADPLVFEMVSVIIEEFFRDNANVMLYICDPSDNRQEARARLYRHWYETYEHHDLYTLSDAAIDFEQSTVYAGMLLRKDHPAYQPVLDAFEAFVHLVPYDRNILTK